jgi:hypothetical protein
LKKGSIVVIVLALLLFSSASIVHATDTPQLTLDPEHVDVLSVGETFTVNLTLVILPGENITDLWGWQARIGYDTTILDCLSVSLLPGHPFEGKAYNFPSASIEDADGYVLFTCSLISFTENINVTETVGLSEITFNSTGTGTSDLEFQRINLTGGTYMAHANGVKIPFEYANGDVTIVPEFPLLILMSLFMITTIAAVFLTKKGWLKKGRN